MISDPPSNPLPIPSNPCSFRPPYTPGGLEHSPRVGTLGGVQRPGREIERTATFAFFANRPAFALERGQESRAGDFRTLEAIFADPLPCAPKPVSEGVR